MHPPSSSSELQNAIRLRAREIFERSGKLPGHDLENWSQAEAEILREYETRAPRKAIVINVEGVVYTGEYEAASAGGYRPGEWHAGEAVPVRFLENKMYIRRRNGQELETNIIKRLG